MKLIMSMDFIVLKSLKTTDLIRFYFNDHPHLYDLGCYLKICFLDRRPAESEVCVMGVVVERGVGCWGYILNK